MAETGLLNSFLAAIQASLSVLLVISYGGIASWLNLLTHAQTKAISKLCVQMFLPALLFTHIGKELHYNSAGRYLTVFIWALICHVISFFIGTIGHIWLGMPDWTTVAVMFNNTTSYPLLLITALDQTGILQALLVVDETTEAAVARAKSYFLVFATVSSCLTFSVGPRLIDTEHAPEEPKFDESALDGATDVESLPTESTALLRDSRFSLHGSGPNSIRNSTRSIDSLKQNSFFPTKRRLSIDSQAPLPIERKAPVVPESKWESFSPRMKWWLVFLCDFFNAPLIGAILGVVAGLIHPLHKAFFYPVPEGGFLTAWLTSSLNSIGSLFVPLPILVAGVSLYNSAKQSRQAGTQANRIPYLVVVFVMVIRFLIWPVASISIIYTVATRTRLLGDDPMLWFAMMLMPAGPPAMKLIALVQVSNAGQQEETNIAKLLTVAYIISPILSLTVVGGLRATEAIIASSS